MAKFCGKCGARLDSEGYCPNRCADKIQKGSTQSQPSEVPKQVQDDKMASKKSLSRKESKKQSKLERKAQKKAAKKEKRMNWSTGKKIRRFFLKLILVVVFLAVFVVGITGILTYFDVIDMPIVEEVFDKLGFYSKGISTSELYQQYTEINNQALKIEEKYADDGSVSNEQLPALLEELSVLAEQHKKQGILESYDVEETSIFMKFKSGVGYLYIPTNKDIMSGDQAGNILTVEPYATSAEFLAQYILGGKSPDKAAEEIADSLPELYVFDDAHNQDGFEIEDVGQLGNNKIIIWYGHGGYISEYGSVLGTSVSIKDKTSLSMYEKELENGEMVLGKDCFCLCPSYFDKHIADGALKGSMVYLAACESGRDNRLADVFFRKGATLVVGNTRSIFVRYNLYMMYDFLIALTNTYDDGTYWTAEDALQYAKDENGETDGKFMFCGAEVRLIYPNNESGYRLKPVDALMPIPDSNSEKKIPTDAAEFNGHYYYVYDIDTITDWNMAQEYCEAQGGYLATITSQEENDFLFSYMKQEGYSSAYFGFSDSSSEGTWVWCNGERSSYTNWHSGEPNNENQSENYALFYYKYSDGTWNDGDFGNKTVNGGTAFLCEWGDPEGVEEKPNGGGQPQTTETASERSIALVLDTSGSMGGTPIDETRKAASNFVFSVLQQSASVGVVTYSGSAEVRTDFTQDSSRLEEIVSGLGASGGTNIDDGLTKAYEMLQRTSSKKKIIILMSDGEPNEGRTDEELIAFADEIKRSGVYIYTLGFFDALGNRTSAQYLMERLASEGCHYEVSSADDLVFFFEDIAGQINGQKYIYIRIACPVDVTVTYDGETLTSAADDLNTRTDFGTLTFEDSERSSDNSQADQVKILRLKEGVDYDVQITGTGYGKMDYTIGFMDDEGEYSDLRRFENVKITRNTVIDTTAKVADESVLKVDTDGDGKYDLAYRAGQNEYARQTKVIDWLLVGVIGAGAAALLIVVLVMIRKIKKRKVR